MTAAATLTMSLWELYKTEGDPEARNQLLSQYLGLVHHIARQIATRLPDEVELGDLVSAGTIGLVLALESFELDRGLAFSTYATTRIRGAILDELRSRDWIPRSVRAKRRRMDEAVRVFETQLGRPPSSEELAAALDIDLETYWRWKEEVEGGTMVAFDSPTSLASGETTSLEELVGDQNVAEPTAAMTHEEDVAAVRDAIAELPSRERTVLALYYYEELNLRQIAEVLHLTESRISQIRTQALRRLREKYADVGFA